MKNFFISRRTVLLALLTAASFTACKKETEPAAPDKATQVAGNYTYTELTMGGKTYPASQTNIKGSIEVTKHTASTVNMDFNIRAKADNSEFLVGNVGDVELTDAGGGAIGLRVDSDEVGQVKGDKMTIKGEDEDGTAFTIIATKN
ncbi:hypothetical protein [Tellurirhabdus rosea]|uniref:hypothetical protein n=1 Tax=Tellurirhabdus rosea TaxID=2674997 RepID=UPI0022592C7A|nr:hypothetical protein [Tellurirhabdus rosea]